MPFIYYAVEPVAYREAFRNVDMRAGDFFLDGDGILLSEAQNARYEKSYGVRLAVGDSVTVLGLGDGGGVNAVKTRVRGIFEPRRYKNVFDYINYVDIRTYSSLYNFTGVVQGSLPAALEKGLAASSGGDDSIFALAGDEADTKIDVAALRSESISGYTMIAVKLKDHATVDRVMERAAAAGLGIKVARWDDASGFFSRISSALQAFIYFATALIFLVVGFIFTNTLIINIVERTAEIGTMRALGGEKSFVRRLFLTETLLLNVTAGLVGLLLCLVLVLAFGRSGLPLPDTVAQFLIGGGTLPLALSPVPFVVALAVVAAVSVMATLYPIRVATKITPLAAMSDR
jgi:ABC-type antimicrobial peptide transport system permease subunit